MAASASAIGVAPQMRTSGAGTCGSRKISNAPPDRHGLTTTHAPGASGKWTSPSGSTAAGRFHLPAARRVPPCGPSSARTGHRRNPRSCHPATGSLGRRCVRRWDAVPAPLWRGRTASASAAIAGPVRSSSCSRSSRSAASVCPASPPTPATASVACRRGEPRTAPTHPRPR